MSSSIGPTITHQDSFGGESDSLEYFIKFPGIGMNGSGQTHLQALPPPQPPPTAAPAMASGDSDFVFVVNGDTNNIPIVLLLGWAGCQDKYLMKYSKIYEDRG